MQRQAYKLWYNWLGTKIKDWHDAKPDNKDLKNCIKAMTEIGVFNHSLQTEVDILKKQISLIRAEKNKIIEDLKTEIKKL